MGFIARTDNGSEVLEIRDGALTDLPEAERTNWRTVVQQPVTFDPYTQARGEPVFTIAEPYVNMAWALYALPTPWARFNLKTYAAQARWQKTQAGITLPDGTKIDTTDASQAKIHQTFSLLKEGWATSVDFQAASGWVIVDLATITAVGQAVAAYVEGCFTAQKAIEAAIDAGTITTKEAIDSYAWY